LLKTPNAILLDDSKYREASLEYVFAEARRKKRDISLVDTVIRLVLEDINVRVDGLVTFNRRDFAEICARRNIEIV
jgi:hypothetical protein